MRIKEVMSMIGEITNIGDYEISIKLSFDIRKAKSILNSFVLIKDSIDFLGEIQKIDGNVAHIRLIGEYRNGHVFLGVSRKPSFMGLVYLISKEFIPEILGSNSGPERVLLGKSSIYNVDINLSVDSFFGNHFAIFGSTGSGKSCGVARLLQNIFYTKAPASARILIFDAYGEYGKAFSKLAPGTFKIYTTDTKSNDELLKIPLWLLSVDDIALLLSANTSTQILVIEKALRFVDIFTRKDENAVSYKNSVIASALLEILSSGRNPARIRDQILAILSRYNTEDLNADTKIVQPGYTRTLKQCINLDANGKMYAIELVDSKLQEFVIENIDLSLPDGSYKYTLTNFLDALDFALIDEGILKSEGTYDSVNFLKIRLQNLIKSEYSKYFDFDYVNMEDFITGLFKNNLGGNANIVNFNINYIDDRFAKTIAKIYSRLVFEYTKGLDKRASQPINIILEEAHRYVQNDNDIDVIGYNIFERICKEGRKYGVLMGFISQRPLELSETCVSQCSNYLIFKMTHVRDLEFIKGSVPYVTNEMLEKIQSLAPGTLIAFGKSFNMPIVVELELPVPTPASENAKIYEAWYQNN